MVFFLLSFDKPIIFSPPDSSAKKITLNLSNFSTKTISSSSAIQSQSLPIPDIKPTNRVPSRVVVPQKSSKKKEIKSVEPKVKKSVKKVIKKKPKRVIRKKVTKKHIVKKREIKKHKKVIKKRYTKAKQHKKRVQKSKKSSLASALRGASFKSMYKHPKSSGFSMRTIHQLYGKEYDGFSPTQKRFIKNNLGLIHRITQRTLIRNGYPRVAIQTHQEGTNVVSFYLYPNGDISNLRLKKHIGYSALDRNTIEVIKIAYKEYPHPKKRTKILFYVTYSIR